MNHMLALMLAVTSAFPHATQLTEPRPSSQPELHLGAQGPKIPTADQLRHVAGGDSQAGQIIRDAINRSLTNTSDPGQESKVLTVIADQIPASWLPRLDGVQFQRIALDPSAWDSGCLRLMWVTAARTGDTLEVGVAQGDSCRSAGLTFTYNRSDEGWKPDPERGGGFGSVAGHSGGPCKCKSPK
jgi:hypothetical protein